VPRARKATAPAVHIRILREGNRQTVQTKKTPPQSPRLPKRFIRYLYIYVIATGASVMALELAASRFLAPYFGTSMIVWANVIGLILLALSVGYVVGGRVADRWPDARLLM
jgi:hypothetical protein